MTMMTWHTPKDFDWLAQGSYCGTPCTWSQTPIQKATLRRHRSTVAHGRLSTKVASDLLSSTRLHLRPHPAIGRSSFEMVQTGNVRLTPSSFSLPSLCQTKNLKRFGFWNDGIAPDGEWLPQKSKISK